MEDIFSAFSTLDIQITALKDMKGHGAQHLMSSGSSERPENE